MDALLEPPMILADPNPDALAPRKFQGIPAMERAANGRLWAAWYGGGPGEDRFNYVMLVTSGDDGRTWSDLKLAIDPDGEGPLRAFDPCLWHDPTGRLWLFWAQGTEQCADVRSGVWAITTRQSDRPNPQWSAPVRICDGIMMNKPTVLSDGRWLLAVAQWFIEGSDQAYASGDQGATWQRLGRANVPRKEDRNCDEPMIVQRRDGSLWMLVRTGYGIGESLSTDGGRSWSDVAPTVIPHTDSRFFIRRLQSGNLLLVKHGPMDRKTERSHLTALLSIDDGRTWQGGLMLDERHGVSYPDGVQSADGAIRIIYDFDRTGAREILLAVFTEDDVQAGAIRSSVGKLRVLVNKAT